MSNYKERKGLRFFNNESHYTEFNMPRFEKKQKVESFGVKLIIKIYEQSRRYLHFIIR